MPTAFFYSWKPGFLRRIPGSKRGFLVPCLFVEAHALRVLGDHPALGSPRALAMLRRMDLRDDIVFCGGGALNDCLRQFLAEGLGREVHVPLEPQILAALGAALSATTQLPAADVFP